MGDFDIAYSSLTERYYFVIDNNKYDITEFVNKKIQQGRADAVDEFLNAIPDCDFVGVENLVTIAEKIKERKND